MWIWAILNFKDFYHIVCVCVCVCVCIERERKSAFWDLSASVPLSYFYLNDLSPPSVCLYLARLRFCTVSFSPVGFLHWKGALAAAFPTLTETRLIVASDPPQGRRHLSTITAGALCSCLTLCDPMGCSPPGSSVHVTLQARILGWLPFPPPGDLPDPETEPASPVSPALQMDSLRIEPLGRGKILVQSPLLKLPHAFQRTSVAIQGSLLC